MEQNKVVENEKNKKHGRSARCKAQDVKLDGPGACGLSGPVTAGSRQREDLMTQEHAQCYKGFFAQIREELELFSFAE